MIIFLTGLLWVTATFFLFGEIVGIRITFLNRFNFSFLQNLWFYVFMGLCYIFYLGTRIILPLSLVGVLLHNFFAVSQINLILVYTGCTLVSLTYFLAKWYISEKKIPLTAVSFIPAIALVVIRVTFWQGPIDILVKSLLIALFVIPLIAALVRVLTQKASSQIKNKPPLDKPQRLDSYPINKKLIFIGLDGCDWKLLNKFLKEGKLPILKKLIDNGVFAELKSMYPTDSPLIWNSIFTGKTPSEHRIIFWYKTKFPFLPSINNEISYPEDSRAGKLVKWLTKIGIIKKIPYSTKDRTSKAIWNILTDYNKESMNIGWLFSWPAEPIKGIQVSWYMYPFEEAAEADIKKINSSGLAERVYPENLAPELEKFIVRPSDLEKDDLAQMYFPTVNIDFRKRFADKLNPWDYAKDKSFLAMSHYLLEKEKKFDFFSLYLYGIDAVSHTYWPFFEGAVNNEKYKKEVLSVSDSEKFKEESLSFGKCILRYYEFIDSELGKLLEKIGSDCNVIIASDHGFNFNGTAHANAPSGVFIASGPYIKRGAHIIGNISIYDLLPTLLVLSGIPVGRDMQGRVIKEALADEFLDKFPPRCLESHERGVKPAKDITPELDEATRKGLEKRLKALGYID